MPPLAARPCAARSSGSPRAWPARQRRHTLHCKITTSGAEHDNGSLRPIDITPTVKAARWRSGLRDTCAAPGAGAVAAWDRVVVGELNPSLALNNID